MDDGPRTLGIQRPGTAVTAVMVALGAIWLMFAIALNWAGASPDLFELFCGNTERILHGEVWRLFTAPLMHAASGTVNHILFAILGLVFFAPALESKWGAARMLRFLFFSALIAYTFQMAAEIVLPGSIARRLVQQEYWFGSFPVLEAIAIAWALSFRGQTVRLWFVLPVTSSGMVIFIVAMSALRVVALAPGPEGLLSPFGGMFAGWLLGGGTPSPLRRLYLKLRLAQLDREAARSAEASRARRKASALRVIEGGRGRSGSDAGGDGGPGDGPGGRMLH
ncbi:MAG TPA: rhomboid family intramembrane serine protease [Polyangiaceae bacterium]|nr:rhomboid family intramembrane serine protease [Polyangiaceae bacterium]